MNTKTLILFAAVCSATALTPVAAQSGGAGSGSGSSGSAGGAGTAAGGAATGSGAGTSATGAATSGDGAGTGTKSARAIAAESANARGTPDMSPTMPSRSALETGVTAPGGSAVAGALPPGLVRAPTPPGVSPISGLPKSQLPAVSRGSAPNVMPRDPAAPAADVLEPTGRTATQSPARTSEVAGLTGQPAVSAQNDVAVTMEVPTPPPVISTEPAAPSPAEGDNRVWVPGHYTFAGGQWTYVNGGWQRPPRDGATWVPGHYDVGTRRWTAPHWTPSGSVESRQAPTSPR